MAHKIDLEAELHRQFKRCEALANEAENDLNEKASSRAQAMNALTKMLGYLADKREEVINMERLIKIEKVTIETVNKYLSPAEKEAFLADLKDVVGGL